MGVKRVTGKVIDVLCPGALAQKEMSAEGEDVPAEHSKLETHGSRQISCTLSSLIWTERKDAHSNQQGILEEFCLVWG